MKKLCLIVLLLVAGLAKSWAQSSDGQEAQSFILDVLSKKKNPFAYYPLNPFLFLPTEEEELKMEFQKSYPEGARSYGLIVFMDGEKDNTPREPFRDHQGNVQRFDFEPKRNLFSTRPDKSFYFRKHAVHLNKYKNIGWFLYYNSGFSSDTN